MANVQKDLKLFYNGKDITKSVDILECIVRDVSREESDCAKLLVDHAEKWFAWGVGKNDTIRVTRSGYDTKTMYLNTIVPEEGAFRLYATGAKCAPFPEKWAYYENQTLATIMGACAGEGGMGSQQTGISGGILYDYLLRENMTAMGFVEQLLNREGAVLKCLDGKFVAIGIEYAQKLKSLQTINIDNVKFETKYTDRRDMNWGSVEILTPEGSGKATSGKGETARILSDIQVADNAQALRWAKGILTHHNRMNEILEIEMEFNPGYTAMVRVDVNSRNDTAGQWIVDQVEQDVVMGVSRARLFRCV